MTMDRWEILMNRELDGENTAEQSAELRAHLEEDLEARVRFAELQHVFRTLDETEALVPPADLRARILAAIDQEDVPAARAFGDARNSAQEPERTPRSWRFRFRPGYAFAAVAGFLIGMLVWQQSGPGGPRDPGRPGMPDEWLRGSQLENGHADSGEILEVPIRGGDALGRFLIRHDADGDRVTVDLQAGRTMRLELVTEQAFRFEDLRSRPAGAWLLSAAPGAVVLEGNGACVCTFVLQPSEGAAGAPQWRLVASGDEVDSGRLPWPETRGQSR